MNFWNQRCGLWADRLEQMKVETLIDQIKNAGRFTPQKKQEPKNIS